MTFAEAFDLVRHVLEFLFYVIAGPLLSIFAAKQLLWQRRLDQQLLELQRHLNELASHEPPTALGREVVLLNSLPQELQTPTVGERTD